MSQANMKPIVIPAAQQQQRQRWPGLSATMDQVFEAVGAGHRNPVPNAVRVVPFTYFHRVSLATNNDMATQLTFFNGNVSARVTNMPNQGVLPTETALWARSLSLTIETGLTIAGAGQAAGALIGKENAANAATTLLEALRKIIIGGQLSFSIGDAPIIDCYDLSNFSAGHGFSTNPAVTGQPAANDCVQVLPFNNGSPDSAPKWRFTPMFPILPGKRIVATINWGAAITLAANTAVNLVMELEGLRVSPANL